MAVHVHPSHHLRHDTSLHQLQVTHSHNESRRLDRPTACLVAMDDQEGIMTILSYVFCQSRGNSQMYDQDDDYDYEMITRTVQSFSDELAYRIKIEGILERVQYDDAGEVVERIQVGRIKAIQYWLESVITGRTSVWDLLDADSQEACEIYEELFDPELDEFKLKVSERVKDTFLMRNMLYITRSKSCRSSVARALVFKPCVNS